MCKNYKRSHFPKGTNCGRPLHQDDERQNGINKCFITNEPNRQNY